MGHPSIKASSKGGKDFEPVPAGVHVAICTQVIDLGFQESFNKQYAPKRQVYLKFEIPDVQVEWVKDGKEMKGPATIGRKFGLSISEKSHLRPFLVGWRGKDFTADEEEAFEVTSIIGKICQLSVVHEKGENNGKTYAKISGAFGLVKEQKESLIKNPARGKPSAPLLVYTPDDHDPAVFDQLPDWLKETIENRVDEPDQVEETTTSTTGSTEDFDDDIPF